MPALVAEIEKVNDLLNLQLAVGIHQAMDALKSGRRNP